MLRAAKPGEGRALRELHSASIKALCSEHYTPEQITIWTNDTDEGYEAIISKSPLCLVCEVGDGIAGYVALKKNLEIFHLYVRPERVKRGVGRSLLEAAEQFIIAQGKKQAVVMSSLTAARFYQRCGYTAKGASEVRFAEVPFIVEKMEKALAA